MTICSEIGCHNLAVMCATRGPGEIVSRDWVPLEVVVDLNGNYLGDGTELFMLERTYTLSFDIQYECMDCKTKLMINKLSKLNFTASWLLWRMGLLKSIHYHHTHKYRFGGE